MKQTAIVAICVALALVIVLIVREKGRSEVAPDGEAAAETVSRKTYDDLLGRFDETSKKLEDAERARDEAISRKVELEFCPYLLPEFVFTGHEVCRGGVIELPEKHKEYFDLILANPDVFPGFYHIDLEGNVLPKLTLLRQFGFYPEPEPDEQNAESCGAHSPRIEPQELATRVGR